MSLPPSNVNQCVTDLIPYQAIGIGREGPAFICCRSFTEADAANLENIVIGVKAQLIRAVNFIVDHFLDQPNTTLRRWMPELWNAVHPARHNMHCCTICSRRRPKMPQ